MAVTINSGELIHKVVFKQPTSSLNDEREKEITYADAITTMAMIKNATNTLKTEGNATPMIGSFDFYVRRNSSRDEIDKEWLIGFNSKSFTIWLIDIVDDFGQTDPNGRFLKFTAKVRS